MPIIVFNSLCALFVLVLESNFFSAFHVNGFCANACILAACVLVNMGAPFAGAVACMLIVGGFADSLASGPPGLYYLIVMVSFFILSGISSRMRFQRIIILGLIAGIMSVLFDLAYGMVLALTYPDSELMGMLAHAMWQDALATALLMPLYYFAVHKLCAMWHKRRQSA